MKVKEKYLRLLGIPILALLMMYITHDHEENESFLFNYVSSLLFTGTYWNGAFLLFIFYRKHFPEIQDTIKRLSLTILSLITFVFVAGTVLKVGLGFIELKDAFKSEVFFEHRVPTLIACIFIGSIYESAYFFEMWKETIRQNEALKNQQLRTQFEVLQNQMSPHFLFNSLNTLTTLIAENQETAIGFTERLSEVYRYILQSKDQELTSLQEEIAFSKAYIYLLQIRYPENLIVDFSIEKHILQKYIAPLTIQMLLENCIKHNVISKSRPLRIEIYSDNGLTILVKNNLQKKKSIEKSTKTGLKNIKKRYQYLGKDDIQIITTHQNFIVAIPLLEIIENHFIHSKAI